MADLLELAKRVKRGVRLLDQKFPLWRRTMRRHEATFDLRLGDYCILGTLEHHLGRARTLRKRRGFSYGGYLGLRDALNIDKSAKKYGFYWDDDLRNSENQIPTLTDLWRAEFER
jgi:hypothetical protein